MINDFLALVRELVRRGEIRISEHGYDELVSDGLTAREVVAGVEDALLVEEYPGYHKGPCILLLQKDCRGDPVHVVWGIPGGYNKPAVLVTAYRPDIARWDENYLKRR